MVRSLKQAKRAAEEVGIEVRTVPKTGEVRFVSPLEGDHPLTVNNRRHDSTREIEKMITRVINAGHRQVERIAEQVREDGQGLAEYALILSLIAIVAIVSLAFLGGQVALLLSRVGNSV